MKKILFVIWLSVLILVPFNKNAVAADVVISGSSQFDCSLSAKFMEKHGYVFIEESYYESYRTTNMYAATGSKVIVEDEEGTVLGTVMLDEKGKFSIAVPAGDKYKVIVSFHGNTTIKHVQSPKLDNITVYLGYYKSETVDNWLRTAALDDCDNC